MYIMYTISTTTFDIYLLKINYLVMLDVREHGHLKIAVFFSHKTYETTPHKTETV